MGSGCPPPLMTDALFFLRWKPGVEVYFLPGTSCSHSCWCLVTIYFYPLVPLQEGGCLQNRGWNPGHAHLEQVVTSTAFTVLAESERFSLLRCTPRSTVQHAAHFCAVSHTGNRLLGPSDADLDSHKQTVAATGCASAAGTYDTV